MDNTSWTAPPGAAQPMGIQSTAGAVPIMNDKGMFKPRQTDESLKGRVKYLPECQFEHP